MKVVLQLLILLVSSLSAGMANADSLFRFTPHESTAFRIAGGHHGRRPAAPPGADSRHARPPPPNIRPQGDLRGDIYRHMQEQRRDQPPRNAPAPARRDHGHH